MKLKDTETNRYSLRDLAKLPPGPARLASRLKILDADIAKYPLDANPPAEVTEALKVYEAEAVRAKQASEQIETAEQAAKQAAAADVERAMQAVRENKAAPKLTQIKADENILCAVVDCEAAGRLLEEAHAALVDVCAAVFPAWRAQIVRDAAAAHTAASEAMQKAAAALATARSMYSAVGTLSSEVLGRDAKLAEAARAETRQGLPWYESTHNGRPPLKTVSITRNRTPIVFPMADVVAALAAAVAEQGDFPQGDWLPPTDPDHADLLAAPLDLEAPWVRSAVARAQGTACAFCRLPHADTVVQDGATLVLVHGKCREPDAKEKKRLDARAAMSRRGYDAAPGKEQHWMRG